MPSEMTADGTPLMDGTAEPLSREVLQEMLLAQRRSVFLLCLGYARNASEAQDLTQETYLRALRHPERIPTDHLRPWLLCLARNLCLDQLRRQKVRRLFQPWLADHREADAAPEQIHSQSEQTALVRRAITGLSGKLRDVLVLREYNDLSYGEIAETLNISEGTVMSRLHRARAEVAGYVKEKQYGTRR